jgi:5-(carboxyamino)imidazole ribonucleotide synthase
VKPILPGATIGILGSGQLGRMTALAARAMGYHVAVDPHDPGSPAGQVADRDISRAAVITYEFENIEPREFSVPVRPGFEVLRITQNRLREKTWLRDHAIPVTPFVAIASNADFDRATYPGVLKTAGYGYDGKGQTKVASAAEARAAWDGEPAVLEQWIPFRREFSVVAARGLDGCFAHYGVIENDHANHILDISRAPVRGAESVIEITRMIFDKLNIVGLACVEFFETHEGEVMVNEIAPRPHNSGHLTIEACATSQFEQQVRAVCGLPLGSTEYVRCGAMANLLGELWSDGEPDWGAALADPRVKLHLYGKSEPKPGRKMGHLTATASTVEEAEAAVRSARERIHRRRT